MIPGQMFSGVSINLVYHHALNQHPFVSRLDAAEYHVHVTLTRYKLCRALLRINRRIGNWARRHTAIWLVNQELGKANWRP